MGEDNVGWDVVGPATPFADKCNIILEACFRL